MTSQNCPTAQQLSAYHDGELPADQQAAVAAHVSACGPCAVQLKQLESISAKLAASVPEGLSQIALHRLHKRLDDVIDRGLIRWAWEISGVAAAVLLIGSIWLSQAVDPSSASASVPIAVSVPPWVISRASADPVVGDAAAQHANGVMTISDSVTPAAAWYLVDARNSSDVSP